MPSFAQVLILADTHGHLDPRVLQLAQGCAWVLHAGDVGAATVLQALAQAGRELIAVRGNNDQPGKWPDGGPPTLPAEAYLELPGGRIVVVHGHQENPVAARHEKLRQRFPQARAIVYGHSHRLVCDLEHKPWVLNPGAAGRARTYGGPSCILLHIRGRSWRVEPVRFPKP
jgi:putative phosphoesterase